MPPLRCPARRSHLRLGLGLLATVRACGDGERVDALEARIAELERRTTDTANAIEPLADVPNALEHQQRELAVMRDGQDAMLDPTARTAGTWRDAATGPGRTALAEAASSRLATASMDCVC